MVRILSNSGVRCRKHHRFGTAFSDQSYSAASSWLSTCRIRSSHISCSDACDCQWWTWRSRSHSGWAR